MVSTSLSRVPAGVPWDCGTAPFRFLDSSMNPKGFHSAAKTLPLWNPDGVHGVVLHAIPGCAARPWALEFHPYGVRKDLRRCGRVVGIGEARRIRIDSE